MSYYILPKVKNILDLKLKLIDKDTFMQPYISFSLIYYYNELITQFKNAIESDFAESSLIIDDIIKATNPYEYIFTKVPGTKFSVSKLKPTTNIMYDLFEIYSSTNIFEKFKHNIHSVFFSHSSSDIAESIQFFRDDARYNDVSEYYDTLQMSHFTNNITSRPYHFIFYETKYTKFNDYLSCLIQITTFILRYQMNGGNCVIKINATFDKSIIELIYMFTTLYEKTYIVKPNTNNMISFDKYIVCKGFFVDETNIDILKGYYTSLSDMLPICNSLTNKKVESLLNYNIPCYFTNKLDDINIIIGQQQLEIINLIISILKNKNKEEKIETIRKTNIQKCIIWCEKFGIPHNKFTDRINIFLPIINKNNVTNNQTLSNDDKPNLHELKIGNDNINDEKIDVM